ncbi:RNA polymerase sigma factor [Leifsonia sp. NPDC058248]|uniref:RNA polymerase sigma factor n=1 Tax=Leifsonia sp. NPDC058248 TaxID=3346402 RepID=UPI0036DCCC1A
MDEISDLTLVGAARGGDSEAYALLWGRHRSVGIAIAVGYSNLADPEDLVAEAFLRTYSAILSGGGPSDTFRGYLLSTIRRLALNAGRRSAKTVSIEELEYVNESDSAEASAVRNHGKNVVARAFQSLPLRWQQVLWYSVVEGTSHSEIARRLEVTTNAVDQLAHRAREGLREKWIQQQVQMVKSNPTCGWVSSRAGAAARCNLTPGESARLTNHVAGCRECAAVIDEAHHIASRFA